MKAPTRSPRPSLPVEALPGLSLPAPVPVEAPPVLPAPPVSALPERAEGLPPGEYRLFPVPKDADGGCSGKPHSFDIFHDLAFAAGNFAVVDQCARCGTFRTVSVSAAGETRKFRPMRPENAEGFARYWLGVLSKFSATPHDPAAIGAYFAALLFLGEHPEEPGVNAAYGRWIARNRYSGTDAEKGSPELLNRLANWTLEFGR